MEYEFFYCWFAKLFFCFSDQAIWYASAAHMAICKPVYMCVLSDQVPGSDGVSGSSTGCRKDKIPGWVGCRQGPLCPPPQACGEERRGALSGQHKAGWVYTPLLPCFFYFPTLFYFLSPGRTVRAHPCCAFLPTGAISQYATLNICMYVFERECFQRSGIAGGKQLSLSGAKYQGWESWGKRKRV